MPQSTRPLISSASPSRFPDPIPGIILAGTLNFFAGASGAGKSRMLAEWWVRWITGRTICGRPTHAPTALYWLFADRSWFEDGEVIFAAHGLSTKDIPHYNVAEDTGITPNMEKPEHAIKLLERGLDALAPIPGSLVIVDPLSPLFIKGSQNDPRAVAWSLLAARRICHKRQIGMIATAYYVKQKGGSEDKYTRAIDRLSGSGAFAGYGQTVMYIEEPTPERLYYLFGWRPRHAPETEFNFQIDEHTGLFTPYTGALPLDFTEAKDRPARLLTYIPESGVDTKTLETLAIAQLDCSRATLYRDLAKLEEHAQIRTERGRVYRAKGVLAPSQVVRR